MKAFYHLRVRRWLFPVLIFAIIYFSIDFSLWMMARHLHIRSFPPEVRDLIGRFHKAILCGAAVIYGLRRSSGYHPATRKGYRDWLRSTPWHPGMRLPLGPAMLAWRDLFVVFSLLALAHWHAHVSVLLILLSFCCAFEVVSLLALSSTYGWGAYGILFGLAFVVRWIHTDAIAAGFSAGILAFTQYALHRSLAGFPWEPKPSESHRVKREGSLEMIPQDTKPLVSARSALAGSALLGVWLWCFLCLREFRFSPTAAHATLMGLVLMAITGLVMLFRWTAYCGKYPCSVTLLGRIATGRWIVPGYDYAMLAPATALPVAGLLPVWLTAAGLSSPVVVSITAAACLAILLIAPPSMRIWQLTGTHRAVGFAAGRRRIRA